MPVEAVPWQKKYRGGAFAGATWRTPTGVVDDYPRFAHRAFLWDVIFFFKHKTAYEILRSDWSSDVCSSDLEDAQTRREMAAQPAPRPPGHGREQRLVDRGGTRRIGIRKARTRDRPGPRVMQARPLTGHAGLHLAQAPRARKLGVEHRQKLVPTAQPPHPIVAAMAAHQPVERGPVNPLGQLLKYGIMMAHGVDPVLAPERGETSGTK